MDPNLLPRELVAQRLAVSSRVLSAFERRGLVRVVRDGDVEGYPAAEVRRLWTVVSLHRDAGVNLAGIEAILQLQAQMDALCRRLRDLARELDEALPDADASPPHE
jgi:DNA-binding transcriptional MerR regulator